MRKLPTTLESKMKIRFQDCDPYGHLNNSKYIDYIMTARGDQLIEFYDFDIYKMAQQAKLGWVAAQTQRVAACGAGCQFDPQSGLFAYAHRQSGP